MRQRHLAAIAPSILAALALPLHAQQAQSPQPQTTFRSGAALVPVDVLVLDKDRHPVRGLTPDDFTLLVDGKPRPIAAFSEVNIPGGAAAQTGAAWVRNAPHDVARLDLPPGSYDIRVAAKDDAGRVGSVFTFVDVPDFSRAGLAAPGMFLHHDQAVGVTANPIADLVAVVPTVQRVFTPGDKVSAFVRVYHTAGAQPLSITERVTDTSDRTVFERALDVPAEDRGEATDVDIPLPLSQLAPGQYLLTLTIARGRLHVDRQARFEIAGGPGR